MKNPATETEARISEIFSSLQGEGARLGERHLFIRFEECHIHCGYCDELDKPGRLMHLEEVIQEVMRLEIEEGPHAFISLTGGEPLLYVPFLKSLMPRLREKGFRFYLETNGILWKALEEVLLWSDCIAIDMKPASVTQEANFDAEHEQFLKIARKKEVFVKIILSREIAIPEFEAQLQIVRRVDPDIPVLLVPLSSEIAGHEDPRLMQMMEELQRRGQRLLSTVRIVPRLHKILKIR